MQANTQTSRHRSRFLIVAVVLVVLMVSMVPRIGSAEEPSGPRPEVGTLTIHKYSLEEMDDMGSPSDGNPTSEIPQNAVPLEGISFSVWMVNPQAPTDNFEKATDAYAYVLDNTLQIGVTDAAGEVTFTLNAGLYYVAETGYASGTDMAFSEPFLVSVPMADPVENKWITEVHVYPKNQHLTVDKFVGDPGNVDYEFADLNVSKNRPVATGEAFGFSVLASLPANLHSADPESYTITDDMSTSFDFISGTLKVYSVPTMTTSVASANQLSEGIDYIYSYNSAEHTLIVSLTDQGMDRMGVRYTEFHDRFLMVKYDCALNNTAQNGVALYSDAEVEYARNTTGNRTVSYVQEAQTSFANYSLSDNSVNTFQVVEGDGSDFVAVATVALQPEVNIGQIEITKYKDGTDTLLAGAEFGIAETEADALAGNFIAIGTTNASGKLIFTGLRSGIAGDGPDENSDNTTFWLVETKAPKGYKLMKGAAEIVSSFQADGNSGEYYFARINVYDVEEGSPGDTSLIPKTSDEMWMFALGTLALVIAGAITVSIIARRRKALSGKIAQ